MFLLWVWVKGLARESIFWGEFPLLGEIMGLDVSDTDLVGD